MSATFTRRRALTISAATAEALHLRRQLAQAAEHGATLLASLGLPRLVTPDFVALDPMVIGEAVEAAVAALDAMDGDADTEPWLGWTGADLGRALPGDTLDREAEDLDEYTLGWSALYSQLNLGHGTDDGDTTALERAGRGFVRCGPDDAEEDDPAEDSDPAERDEEHGSDDAEDIGHHTSQYAPRPLTPMQRAEVAAIASRVREVVCA